MSHAPSNNSNDTLGESINTSGLLFQQNPSIGNWEATRAAGPEVAAFTNPDLKPDYRRVSLLFHAEGEVDEDEYEYEDDTWTIEVQGTAFDRPYPSFTDKQQAIQKLREILTEATTK